MFCRYLREVFGTWWGTLFVIAGLVSTAMTFVLIYAPVFALPRWLPAALSAVACLIAPYRLYQKQQNVIQSIQLGAPRRAVLMMREEPGSYYIRCYTPQGITPKGPTGMYFEAVVSIENKGSRSAIVSNYDLEIDGVGQFAAASPSPQSYVLGRTAQHALNPAAMVRKYIEIPAERLAPHNHIPFMLPTQPAVDVRTVRCWLTVTDTEGNIAKVQIEAGERGA
ncbi:MAG: hypothetical protein JWO13_452 [Acidobacteriales bacterium]|nr:hypothetical protein [Terriglobales bacterium]